jgi:hypothetical protein
MVSRAIKDKIAGAFDKENAEYKYVDSYLTDLRASWRDNEKGNTRFSELIVGLAVLFEFVFSNKASATSFLSIKLTNASIIEFSLVVIVAYLYYTVMYSFAESQIMLEAHDAIIERIYPELYKASAQLLLTPANSLVTGAERISVALETGSRKETLSEFSWMIRPVAILLGPPLFIIAANIQLFIRYGLTNGLLWTSLVISGILLIAGCVNAFLLWKVTE